MAKKSLTQLREELGQLDASLMALFETRQELAQEIYRAKEESGFHTQIFDPIQEEKKLLLVADFLREDNRLPGLSLLSHVMQLSRLKQYSLLLEPVLEEKIVAIKQAYVDELLPVSFVINRDKSIVSQYLELFQYAGAPILEIETLVLEDGEDGSLLRVNIKIGRAEDMKTLAIILAMLDVELT